MALTSRDPRDRFKTGWYITDGERLIELLALDADGGIGECCKTSNLVKIKPVDLFQKWRRVTPAEEG